MRFAAWIARTTADGAPAGMLAFPPARIVAVPVGGGDPAGAPGSAVVVVVPLVWPAAGAVAIRAAANSRPAKPSLRGALREPDSKNLSSKAPPGRAFFLQTTVAELAGSMSERSQMWTIRCSASADGRSHPFR